MRRDPTARRWQFSIRLAQALMLIATSVPEFQPLDLRLRLVDGNFGSGSSGGSASMSLIPRPDGPIDRGQTCSLILDERGIGSVPFQFRFRQPGNPSWVSALKSTGGAQSSGSSRILIERDYQVPIDTIDDIEISIAPVP